MFAHGTLSVIANLAQIERFGLVPASHHWDKLGELGCATWMHTVQQSWPVVGDWLILVAIHKSLLQFGNG
jgi:hypothetical protein